MVVAAVAFSFVALAASPASAHYVYQEAHMHRSSDLCVHVRSEISHGDGGGYVRTDVTSTTLLTLPIGSYQCALSFDRPAGYIAAKSFIMKWNGSAWAVCAESAWDYNTGVSSVLGRYGYMGTSPWCGSGSYSHTSHGYVWNNNTWYGGGIDSGAHYLPDYSRVATPTQAPPANGELAGVIDADGNPVFAADGTPVLVPVGSAPPVNPETVTVTGAEPAGSGELEFSLVADRFAG